MRILIIGCGYVGSNLAKLWTEKGNVVTCTTKNPDHLKKLEHLCTKSMILNSSDESELELLFQDADLIIVTVAADHEENYEKAYLDTAEAIRHTALKLKQPKKLFYTSSTKVYGDHQGKWVDEVAELNGKDKQCKILIDTEKTYESLKELGWKVTIFRLSEIYGPGRSLLDRIRRLEGHVIPGEGKNFTNMIHLEDIIHAIDYTFEHHLSGIFNLSDDEHPVRKEFYDRLSDHAKLERVIFDPHLKRMTSGNKRVSNHKIKSAGYQFKQPKRLVTE